MTTRSKVIKSLNKERILAIIVLAVVAVFYAETFKFSAGFMPGDLGSAGTYPRLLLIIIGLLAGIILIRPPSSTAEETASPEASLDLMKYAKPLAVIALFAVYVVALQPLGFTVATVAFLLITQLVIMEKRRKKSIVIAFLIAFTLPISLQYIFTEMLRVFLP